MATIAELIARITAQGAPQAAAQINQVSQAAGGLERAATGAGTAVGRGLAGAFYVANLAAEATIEAAVMFKQVTIDLIKESAALNAQYETQGVVLETVARNAGVSARTAFDLASQIEKQGITMLGARQAAQQLITANFDLSKSSELVALAQGAAVMGMTDSSDALQRLIYGIRSGQTDVLRTIGINVSFEESYRNLAKEIGKTQSQLTEAEKQQARFNAVLAEAPKFAGVYESAMMTAGKQQTSMNRYIEDTKLLFGELFSDSYRLMIFQTVDSLKSLQTRLKELSESGQLRAWSREIAASMAMAMDYAVPFVKIMSTIPTTLVNIVQTSYNVGKALGGLANTFLGAWNMLDDDPLYRRMGFDQIQRGTKQISEGLEGVGKNISDIDRAFARMDEGENALSRIATEGGDATRALDKMYRTVVIPQTEEYLSLVRKVPSAWIDVKKSTASALFITAPTVEAADMLRDGMKRLRDSFVSVKDEAKPPEGTVLDKKYVDSLTKEYENLMSTIDKAATSRKPKDVQIADETSSRFARLDAMRAAGAISETQLGEARLAVIADYDARIREFYAEGNEKDLSVWKSWRDERVSLEREYGDQRLILAQEEQTALDTLEAHKADLLASGQDFEAMKLAIQSAYAKKRLDLEAAEIEKRIKYQGQYRNFIVNMAKFEKMNAGDKTQFVLGTLADLAQGYAQYSKHAFKAWKTLAIAGALVDGYRAIQSALADVRPYPLNVVAAGIITAQTALNVRNIKNTEMGSSSDISSAGGAVGSLSSSSAGGIGAADFPKEIVPLDTQQTQQAANAGPTYNITITGNISGDVRAEDLVADIKDLINNGDFVLIDRGSRNGRILAEGVA